MEFMVVVEGDAGGWKVDREALTEVIRAHWPDVRTDRTDRSEVRSVIWEMETEYGWGEAYLHRDGTCLYLDVWEKDAIRLATAFRHLTPPHLRLVFCDEGYSYDVRVPAGATEEELAELVRTAG
ncbi:hypothetical protein [Streptomyces sp. NPDC094049]|uniref:hypothetical protein n=1 Tax=Streptomyces sp. NPDC094049 TaxID=3154987 RepID=UPI003328CEE2